MPRDLHEEARAWRAAAAELAAWTDAHLVNRRDVWGEYLPPSRRPTPNDKSRTAPAKGVRGHVQLSPRHLHAHFAGARVMGLHASDGAASRWLAFDFDCHAGDPATRAENLAASGRLVAALRVQGCAPVVEDSDGRGGLHVWVLFDAPVPTADAFCFADDLRTQAGATCEVFPKQRVIPPGRFGNWLRLPGRHHTRAHWSRMAHAGRWLAGRAAVGALLAAPSSSASRVPAAPPAILPSPAAIPPRRDTEGQDRRVAAYLAKVDRGLRDGRKCTAFRLGAALLHDFGLSPNAARSLLAEWNADNVPPLDDATLAALLVNAGTYGRGGRAA